MKLAKFKIALGLLLCVTFHLEAENRASSLKSLQSEIKAHLAQPRFANATWGIKVVSQDTGIILYEHNAHKLLKPASNAKLYTAALALDQLGPKFQIRTSLFAPNRPDSKGRLSSDLIILGRGDPSFAARFHSGDYNQSLQPLVKAIRSAGIRRIEGDLVGDESFFNGPPFGTGWAWDDLQYYFGAEVSALTVDDNIADLFLSAGNKAGDPCRLQIGPTTPMLRFFNRTITAGSDEPRSIRVERPLGKLDVVIRGQLPLGETNYSEAVTVPRPAYWFLARLKEALNREGIEVEGNTRIIGGQATNSKPIDYSPLIELGHVKSRPLSEIVNVMMKRSQNLYAQLLWLQVGARAETNSTQKHHTTEAAGRRALETFVQKAGIPVGEVLLEEGSGLSHGSAVTPHATASLLAYMARHRHASNFRDSLPMAGVDGSLRLRLKDTPAAGNVRAKPGHLHHVSTLSGYLTTAAGERLIFSFMLNHYQPPPGSPPSRVELDQLVRLLARFEGQSKP